MSILASRVTKTIDIPASIDPDAGDHPNTVTIRALAGRHLGRAREEVQVDAAINLRRMGGVEFQREFQKAMREDKQADKSVDKPEASEPDPLDLYDRYIVLQRGIVSWTLRDEDGKPLPVATEVLDDLSNEAADFIAREILALTIPARDEAAKKNG